MKKLILLLALGFLSIQGFSQKNGIGIKAGLSSTQVNFENPGIIPSDAQTGFHLGVFGRFGGAGFFVQPELLITQTSGKFGINIPGVSNPNQNVTAEFNRLDLPLMMGFRLLKIIRLMGGPIASINMNSTLKDATNAIQNADFKSTTLGYQAGLGIDIGNLTIEGKYEGGLSTVTDKIATINTDNRINQYILSVGFKIF
jgi:hypothetical protein